MFVNTQPSYILGIEFDTYELAVKKQQKNGAEMMTGKSKSQLRLIIYRKQGISQKA